MSDSPTVHLSLAELDRTLGDKPEPFRFALKSGHITFPDPGEMDWQEAEKFLEDLRTAESGSAMMARWLSAADLKKLETSKLTLRQMGAVAQAVQAHYKDVFGGPGEGGGSTAS